MQTTHQILFPFPLHASLIIIYIFETVICVESRESQLLHLSYLLELMNANYLLLHFYAEGLSIDLYFFQRFTFPL